MMRAYLRSADVWEVVGRGKQDSELFRRILVAFEDGAFDWLPDFQ
jgi:hypothetical protein